MFVLSADRDALRASGEAIAHELDTAGVQVTAKTIPGTAHSFLNKPASPSFTTGVKLLVDRIDKHDPSTTPPHAESPRHDN